MCRWMAWFGQPVLIEEVVFKTQHGIVDQSLHARMGAEPTNGDGFGMGWYGTGDGPGLYRSVTPAWADENLRELAGHLESPLFLAHVRAAIGSPVQGTNCHPFRHGEWLFVHNGFVGDFHAIRRDLMLAIDPVLFPDVAGSTDTEVIFNLALTLGFEADPIHALERPAPRWFSTPPHRWASRTTRSTRSSARWGRSRRPRAGAGSSPWCRRASGCPTASRCGPSATRPRARRGHCSPRRTSTRSAASTPTTRACSGSARTTG